MKFLIFFILSLATVSAFNLRRSLAPKVKAEDSTNADLQRLTYQVGITFEQEGSSENSWCSGSLIDNEWILTAAHCAMDAISATVYLGAISDTSAAQVIHTVTEDDIIMHSDWEYGSAKDDICLIKIPYTTYTDEIRSVKLPTSGSLYVDYAGDYAVASGWSQESESFSSIKADLKLSSLQVISKKACNKIHGSLMNSKTFCAATPEDDAICSTDSGSPLVLEFSKTQIGLIAKADCSVTNSAVFTRISSYLDWISSHTGISF